MLTIAATLLGGLGLFMLAVTMITDGLKLAARDTLKDILGQYTRTPLRGVASGMLVTAVVQSSSAVTVATIGFVNAGLLNLGQSLGVVYGANIGTTMTGWLVATVGFGFKLDTLALPLIGLGMLGRLLGTRSRLGAVGEAVAGFGLFFVGVEVLRGAFESFSGAVDVASFAPQGGLGVALYVALGFAMTVLTQSSSAAIALTLTAATGGALGLSAAAAMVIGANVGTTSTAVLATIGATANARRVAAAHVVFNGVTGAVALALLPGVLWLTGYAGAVLGLPAAPAVTLALFHSVFNLLGVALMLPLTPRLAAFLGRRFVTRVEVLARPQFLDRTVLVTPSLAIEALRLELARAAGLARDSALAAVSSEGATPESARELRHGLRGLLEAIESFVADLEASRMSADSAGQLPLVLRVTNYLEDVVTLADSLDHHRPDLAAISRAPVLETISGYRAAVVKQVSRCDLAAPGFDLAALDAGFAELEANWHRLKTVLLEAAGRRQLPLERLNEALEGLRSGLRMAEQMTKAARRLDTLGRAQEKVD
ncbi:MAG: Na/Pi symporter [Pseudomonadales bacterium]